MKSSTKKTFKKPKDFKKKVFQKPKDKFNDKKKFNKDSLNKERYWKKDVPEEENSVTKPKANLNSYSKNQTDFIGLKRNSQVPKFPTNKQKKQQSNFNSEKYIEKKNLSKKINIDDIPAPQDNTYSSTANGNKAWQGNTYDIDSKKRPFKDRPNFNGTTSSILNNKSSVHSDNDRSEKALEDSLKVEISPRPKAEFIRTPEKDVQYYENKWYSEFRKDPSEENKLSEEEISALKSEAEKIMSDEIRNFHTKSKDKTQNQEAKWMKTVVSKGTSGDKVAAQVIMIQDDPVFHLNTLNSLVNSVKVSKKKECLLIMDNLTELFLSDLLHPSRHLLSFEQQSLSLLNELTQGNALARRRRLMTWLFEHELRSCYLRYVMAVCAVMNDTLQSNREKAISAVSKLLIGNCENEELLLANLVNKIGDPIQKVSAKVVYSLGKLVAAHPGTKRVVLNQVEKLLFRPNIGKRAQYYGTCFLAQFKILRNEASIADGLMSIYFSFFKSCVKTGDIDSRLMKALLTGVSRAFPYATKDKQGGHVVSGQHIETIFKIVHLASFTVSVHALSLLFRVARSDRYYSALYKQILHPMFPMSSMQNLFLNVVYQSVDKDENEARVRTFIKRLLEVCMTCPVPLACGILFILSQIIQRRPQLLYTKQMSHSMGGTASLQGLEDDDDEEKYEDVKTEEDDKDTIPPIPNQTPTTITLNDDDEEDVKPVIGGSWVHRAHLGPKTRSDRFEPLHRNPAFANGDKAVFTELEALTHHFHPTVTLFASNILSKSWVSYSGDPLVDFTLSRFLDRFSYRNPKKHSAHILASGVGEKRRFYNPGGLKGLAVNTDEYLNHNEQSIPVDELFLYKYLRQKRDKKQTELDEKKAQEKEEKKKKKSGGEDGEEEEEDDDSFDENSSVCSEEFNEMLDNMMGGRDTEELDFADDVTASKTQRKDKKKKKDGDDSDSDSESGGSGDEDEEDEDDGSMDEAEGEASDLDMDDLSGEDEEDGENEVMDFGGGAMEQDDDDEDDEEEEDEDESDEDAEEETSSPAAPPARAKQTARRGGKGGSAPGGKNVAGGAPGGKGPECQQQ
uniref:CCAAT/enhancer-binding protein zeta n=1 Tax=Cacopsylla melanoneura TaxID=428564 RepID=A0A8D8TM19_9HEMI